MFVPECSLAAEPRQAVRYTVIPSLSAFLIGLYFGQSLPPGVDLVVLQTGLIGMLAFLGLTFQASQTPSRPVRERQTVSAEDEPEDRPSWYVERRLDRHVDQPRVHSRPLAELRDLISRANFVGNGSDATRTDGEPVGS